MSDKHYTCILQVDIIYPTTAFRLDVTRWNIKMFFYISGINSNEELLLAEDYPKVTTSTAILPAFNRLPSFPNNSHRNAPYTVPVPTSSSYSDWPYTENAGSFQANLLNFGTVRARTLSASASLSASKFLTTYFMLITLDSELDSF